MKLLPLTGFGTLSEVIEETDLSGQFSAKYLYLSSQYFLRIF